jgi:hypothetical protein
MNTKYSQLPLLSYLIVSKLKLNTWHNNMVFVFSWQKCWSYCGHLFCFVVNADFFMCMHFKKSQRILTYFFLNLILLHYSELHSIKEHTNSSVSLLKQKPAFVSCLQLTQIHITVHMYFHKILFNIILLPRDLIFQVVLIHRLSPKQFCFPFYVFMPGLSSYPSLFNQSFIIVLWKGYK